MVVENFYGNGQHKTTGKTLSNYSKKIYFVMRVLHCGIRGNVWILGTRACKVERGMYMGLCVLLEKYLPKPLKTDYLVV